MARRRPLGGPRAMPRGDLAWVGEYVEKTYRPEPKKRIKPRSFKPSQGPGSRWRREGNVLDRWSRLKIKDREAASNDVPVAEPGDGRKADEAARRRSRTSSS